MFKLRPPDKNFIKSRNLFAIFFLSCFNFIYSQSITITSPVGGEVWNGGSSHNITWTASGVSTVNIEYSINGGANWTSIASGVNASNGSQAWTTVPNFPSNALVRIINGSTGDTSARFFIKAPQFSASANIKILPIGNSITFDNFRAEFRYAQNKISYRYRLWDSLRVNNYNVDFIGHKAAGYYQFPDAENNGIPGINSADMYNLLNTGFNNLIGVQVTTGPYLNTYTPDIVLLHIGTNDVGGNIANTVTTVSNILKLIKNKNSNIWTVLALIIDTSPTQQWNSDFNSSLKSMAQDSINAGYKIIIADMQHDAGLLYTIDTSAPFTSGDMYDNQHPNDSGKAKMANLWFKYLKLILPNSTQVSPSFTASSVPDTIAYLNMPYKYNADASGVGAPIYSLISHPSGMTINSKTGIISWTPASTGTNINVTVKAANQAGSVQQNFTIDVLPAPVLGDSIISYWKFDESGSPLSYKDLPGINDAYPLNAPSLVPGITGNALGFNGSNKVNVIDDSSFYFKKTESWTIEMWVKKAVSTGERVFLGKFGGSTNYSIGLNSSNQPKFQILDSSGTTTTVMGTAINDTNWHHIAGRVNRLDGELNIFVDGLKSITAYNFPSSGFFNYDPLTLGYFKNNNFFTGLLDEVAVYNRRLTGIEINMHYISGLSRKGYTNNYVRVRARAYLQGPYSPGTRLMNTTLKDNSLVPKLRQPYTSAPWNYNGLERVVTYPSYPNGVVDWVLVELRDQSVPSVVVARRAAFITSNGLLAEIDTAGTGFSSRDIIFSDVSPGNYYIVIKHRNHLGIMSAAPVALSSSSPSVYDFTTGSSQYFGGSAGAVQVNSSPVVWGMVAGNNNGNNSVSVSDYNAVANNLFQIGYIIADHNMNGSVSVTDYNPVSNNLFKISQVP